jgi:hypothetical protein
MAYTDASSGRRRTPSSHRRLLRPDRRRALELLAASCDGCTEAIMIAHGTMRHFGRRVGENIHERK